MDDRKRWERPGRWVGWSGSERVAVSERRFGLRVRDSRSVVLVVSTRLESSREGESGVRFQRETTANWPHRDHI